MSALQLHLMGCPCQLINTSALPIVGPRFLSPAVGVLRQALPCQYLSHLVLGGAGQLGELLFLPDIVRIIPD